MANILLIENDESLSLFLKRGLLEEAYYVDVVNNSTDGISQVSSKRYDLIIIDIEIPGESGIEVCKQLRNVVGFSNPILLITSVSSSKQIVKILETVADDHIVIPFKFNEILAKINVLLQQDHVGTIVQFADIKFDTERKIVSRGDKVIDLSLKEYKLLEYFITHPYRVISRTKLLEEIWDKNTNHHSTNVVDVYINYLRNKIDKGFPTKLIHTSVGMGYIFRE